MATNSQEYAALKIVVIDDMPMIRKMLVRQLSQIGIRAVFEASDAQTGLNAVIRNRPNLVLCDIHMKESTGFEFLKSLREVTTDKVSETPVIFVTADSELSTVRTAIKLQPNGYLIKPITIEILEERIRLVLQLD